jgi:hypothetical protein
MKSKFAEDQIAFALKQADLGISGEEAHLSVDRQRARSYT